MNHLVVATDCPGTTRLHVYEELPDKKFREIFRASNYTYGFDPKFDYQFDVVDNILDNTCICREDDERPGHTSFDDEMIYRVLTGLKSVDYSGWTRRVRIILSSKELIISSDGVITSVARKSILGINHCLDS